MLLSEREYTQVLHVVEQIAGEYTRLHNDDYSMIERFCRDMIRGSSSYPGYMLMSVTRKEAVDILSARSKRLLDAGNHHTIGMYLIHVVTSAIANPITKEQDK